MNDLAIHLLLAVELAVLACAWAVARRSDQLVRRRALRCPASARPAKLLVVQDQGGAILDVLRWSGHC